MELESFGSKSVQKWLKIGVAAGALLASGCDGTVQTPQQKCTGNSEVVAAEVNYLGCKRLLGLDIAQYCRGKFQEAIQNTMAGCLTLETGQKMECHLSMDGQPAEIVPRFICDNLSEAESFPDPQQ